MMLHWMRSGEEQNPKEPPTGSTESSHYLEVTKRCKAEWAEFTELEAKSTLNDDEKERLAILKNGFNLVLSADYQMAKLVPYWGQTAKPGST